ncbi:MAG: TraR/DksA family transcriptional regulator [Ktedonobacterales bacterium]
MNPELTPEVLSELRSALEAKRERLRTTITTLRGAQDEDHAEILDTGDDLRGESADSSVEQEEWDENHQEELDEDAELAEVEHALEKFDTGTYGICEGCGRLIPLARLRALPEARYDVEHEAEHEDARLRRERRG